MTQGIEVQPVDQRALPAAGQQVQQQLLGGLLMGFGAATAAGLVPFAIGSETWGSIISPANNCGVAGLRPTYGRVSLTGVVPLAWSMDHVGPLTRTVEDAALVLQFGAGLLPSLLQVLLTLGVCIGLKVGVLVRCL